MMFIGCYMKFDFIVYRVCFCREKVVGLHTDKPKL